MSKTNLNLVGNKLLVSFNPKNREIASRVRKIYGTRFNKTYGRWEAPLHCYEQLVNELDNLVISQSVIKRVCEEAHTIRAVQELKTKSYHEIEDYTPKVALMAHQKKAFELHRILPNSGNFSDMGSGKCVHPDTLVNVNGELQRAETLWENFTSLNEIEDPTGGLWSLPDKPLHVTSLSHDGSFSKRRVSKLFRQHIDEKMRVIKTDDGNQITITKAHKLHTKNGWSNNLRVGQKICVPKSLPHEEGQVDFELAELMGWMIGDGNDYSNTHRFTQKEDASRNHVLNLLNSVSRKNNIELNIYEVLPKDRTPYLRFTNKKLKDLIKSKGYKWGNNSSKKEVPSSIMKANKKGVASFLRGYFDAEAYVDSKKYQIEISSASKILLHQVGALLRRFGIWMRIHKKKKKATNGKNILRDYWIGSIGGESSRIYTREIGFFTSYKKEASQKFLLVKTNSNVEGVPASEILKEIVTKTKLPASHIVGRRSVYLTGKQEPSREMLKIFIKNIDLILKGGKKLKLSNLPETKTYLRLKEIYEDNKSYKGTAHQLNKEGLFTKRGNKWHGTTIKNILIKGEYFPYKNIYDNLDSNFLLKKRNDLANLIANDVNYVTITSIQEIDYTGWVYDFEVEHNHNYIAENILCHNTATAICAVHWRLELGQIQRCLIVCPNSVISGWEEQIEFFSNLRYISLLGTRDSRLKKLNVNKDIYLINYEYVHRIEDELLAKNFDMIICDEAHRIKNPEAKQSKSCYKLGDNASYRIALTGSPVCNTSLDVFGVMRFIDPTVFGESFYAFRNKYFVNMNDNGAFALYVPKHGAEDQISDKLESKSIRFLKEQCLDLPPPTFQNIPVTLSPTQAQIYREMRDNMRSEIDGQEIRVNHVLTLMMKLNQVTSGWVKDSETKEVTYLKENPKFEKLKELAQGFGDEPLIVWAFYQADMKILIDYFSKCTACGALVNENPNPACDCGQPIKYRCSHVWGKTKNRKAEIAKFRLTTEERARQREKYISEQRSKKDIKSELGDPLPSGDEVPQTNVIICQCVAASEGLNLQRAKYSVYFSRNWSLKDWIQSLARNHRAGQTRTVEYYTLVAQLPCGDPTVDQRIADALDRKESLSKKINKDDIKLLTDKKSDREAFREVKMVDYFDEEQTEIHAQEDPETKAVSLLD